MRKIKSKIGVLLIKQKAIKVAKFIPNNKKLKITHKFFLITSKNLPEKKK